MKIDRIFDNYLFSIKYSGAKKNEFRKIFDSWHNAVILFEFFEKNKFDLHSGYFGDISVDDAVSNTMKDAIDLEQIFVNLSKKSPKTQIKELNSLFKPLHDAHYEAISLDKSKAKQRWLRIYALKTEDNGFIVTGGAIKLTRAMDERKHTKEELTKLEGCRKYLLKNNIINVKDITEEREF